MKLKTAEINGKTYAEVLDGKPIYVHSDGKEAPFDGPDMYAKIIRDGKALVDLRKSFGEVETKLKAFEGIEDPEAARKAIDTLKNIDEGKLLSAGKVEEIKAAAKKAAEEQVAAANKTNAEELAKAKKDNETLASQLHATMIGGGFARSKLVTDGKHPMAVILPADAAQKVFGEHFKVEDGKIVAKDKAGNNIFSRAKPGELADFDEAFETLVDQYPYKDHILRGTGNKGDGARGSNGSGGGGGQKTITRKEFDALNPLQQHAKVVTEKVQVVD